MPGVARRFIDSHIGHPSFTPNPFHRTNYATGSNNVFVNKLGVVRVGDITYCTDGALARNHGVYVNRRLVHRRGDPTSGHRSWIPNACATASRNVFIGGGGNPGTDPFFFDMAGASTIWT